MLPEANQHILSGAHNTTIHGGIFATVGGNMIVNSTERPGLKQLLDNIAQGAFHDAAERGSPPKCHPQTRVAIRREIMQWIKDPWARQQFILWLYGPAGSGKTAIAQSIAEACEMEGLLSASFFFGRTAPGRNTSARFVATIAYQLSRSIPEIEDQLLTAIEKDRTIFSRSLQTQMRVLVIEPLMSVQLQLTSCPRLVVMDGIDECGPNDKAHTELLQVLGAAVGELRNIPIIFLIASRPEYEIRTSFNSYPLSSLAKSLVLDDKYQPDEDIKIYLESNFRKIQEYHLPFTASESWPAKSDVDRLVQKASGQFIFASTVIKFIDSARHNPVEQLNIILNLQIAGNETPFALLDALYCFVLDSVINVENVLAILALLWLPAKNGPPLTMELAEELLGIDIRRTLIDMHALLFVPPPISNDLPRIYHASLYDCLMDQSRSHKHYIGTNQGHAILSRHWLKIIGNCARSRIDTCVAIGAFIHHCGYLNSPANQEVVDDLARFDLTTSLEQISNFKDDLYKRNWGGFMKCVKQQGRSRDDIFPRLQNDFDNFILNRIGQYPPLLQPYIPIILSGVSLPYDVFDILLHGLSRSAEEFNEWRALDKMLLGVFWASYDYQGHYIADLLQHAGRAGNYIVDGKSYATLAKAIINVICAKPGERNYQIKFEELPFHCDRYGDDGSDPTMRICLRDIGLYWFEELLDKASIDLDLANILCERTVQFRNYEAPYPGRRTIAEASVAYIQKCGIPFLEHTHMSYINKCAICTMCEGAIVVDRILNVGKESPPLPPLTLDSSDLGGAAMEYVHEHSPTVDITDIRPDLSAHVNVDFLEFHNFENIFYGHSVKQPQPYAPNVLLPVATPLSLPIPVSLPQAPPPKCTSSPSLLEVLVDLTAIDDLRPEALVNAVTLKGKKRLRDVGERNILPAASRRRKGDMSR